MDGRVVPQLEWSNRIRLFILPRGTVSMKLSSISWHQVTVSMSAPQVALHLHSRLSVRIPPVQENRYLSSGRIFHGLQCMYRHLDCILRLPPLICHIYHFCRVIFS